MAAAEMAVSSPLLEASIDGAHGVLLSIAGGSDLGLFEINEAAALVADAVHPEANIIFGATIDDALGDEVRVTVIAAGFDGGVPKRRHEGAGLRKDARPVQSQEETRAAAAALAARREGAEVDRSETKETALAGARTTPASQDGASFDADAEARTAPARLRRRRAGRARLPQVAKGPTCTPFGTASAPSTWPSRTGTAGSVAFPSTSSTSRSRTPTRPVRERRTCGCCSLTSRPATRSPTCTRCMARRWWSPACRVRPEADGIVTDRPGTTLLVRAADCVPVLLADPMAGVIGAAHCGRPGLAAGVVPATVARMRDLGAGSTRCVTAWVGPHVCGACYEVPAEMQAEVGEVVPAAVATTSWGTPSLDLGAGVLAQLAAAGVTAHDASRCTRESADLYSYRRDGLRAGRLAGLIRRGK